MARMLVRQAELFIIDDVSSALDIDTERQLWEALAGRAGATFLVVSNRRGAILRADRVLVLDDGKVVAAGSPEELMKTSQELRAILAECGAEEA